MTGSGFGDVLGVVRVLVGGTWVATVPMLAGDAKAYAAKVHNDVAGAKDYPTLIEFDTGDGFPCWIRARDVALVDVVSTGDPSTEGGRS